MQMRPIPAVSDPAAVARELAAREPLSHREPRDADRAHFEAMTAPGMVHIGASGRVTSREDYIDACARRYASGDHGDDATWIVEDFGVAELAPDLWEAAYTLHQGARVTRRTTLWRRSDGRWQAVRHQGTVVGEGA